MTLGEKLQLNRKKAGLSQEDLGAMLFVSRQTVSLWEKDQTVPTVDNLIKLKEIFGISLDELICGESCEKQEGETAECEHNNECGNSAPCEADKTVKPVKCFSFNYTEDDIKNFKKDAWSILRWKNGSIAICVFCLAVTVFTFNIIASICLITTLLAVQIRYEIIKRKRKKIILPTVGANYEYEFYEEYFTLKKLYPDGIKETYYKYLYKDIISFQKIKNTFLIYTAGTTFYLKNTSSEDEFSLAEYLRIKCPSAKMSAINNKSEKLYIILWLFFASFFSLLWAFSYLCCKTGVSPLCILILLVYPIIFIVNGIVLSKQKTPNKNILSGVLLIIVTVIIFNTVNMIITFDLNDGYESEIDSASFTALVEEVSSVDLPDEWKFVVYDESETEQFNERKFIFNKAVAFLSEKEQKKATEFFENDSRWFKTIPDDLRSVIPEVYGVHDFSYAMLVDSDTGEVNKKSNSKDCENYYYMFYCTDDMSFYIYDYSVYNEQDK